MKRGMDVYSVARNSPPFDVVIIAEHVEKLFVALVLRFVLMSWDKEWKRAFAYARTASAQAEMGHPRRQRPKRD